MPILHKLRGGMLRARQACPTWLLILITLVFLSRLPLCYAGVGFDNDVMLVFNSASLLYRTGVYKTSRGPGYPLGEIITAALLGVDETGFANGIANVFLFIINIVLLYLVMSSMNIDNKKILLVIFSFLPLNWIVTSESFIEYTLFMNFLLLSWYLTIRQKLLPAGVVYGFAIASRPSHAIPLMLPLLYLWWRQKGKKSFAILGTVALIAFVFWIMPMLLSASPQDIFWHLPNPIIAEPSRASLESYVRLFFLRTFPYWGFFPSLTLLLAVIYVLISKKQTLKNRQLLIPLSWLLISVALFVYGPYKYNYLFITTPFLIMVLSPLQRQFLVILGAILITHGFVGSPVRVFRIDEDDIGNSGFRTVYFPPLGSLYADYISRVEYHRWIEILLNLPIQDAVIVVDLRTASTLWYLGATGKVALEAKPEHISCTTYDKKRNTVFIAEHCLSKELLEVYMKNNLSIYYSNHNLSKTRTGINLEPIGKCISEIKEAR